MRTTVRTAGPGQMVIQTTQNRVVQVDKRALTEPVN